MAPSLLSSWPPVQVVKSYSSVEHPVLDICEQNLNNTTTVRVLRALATIGFISETEKQTWEATPITKAMATEEVASGHRMV